MGWPVVTVASGGIPVTDNSALGYGIPVDEAPNGMGTAITYVDSGGLAVLGGAQQPGAGMPAAPSGFHWSFVIDSLNGNQSVTDSLNGNQGGVALAINGAQQ